MQTLSRWLTAARAAIVGYVKNSEPTAEEAVILKESVQSDLKD